MKDQIQKLLQSRGYSPGFISLMFRTPREQEKKLSLNEILRLPIDAALDELLSARCYGSNEKTLRDYSASQARMKELQQEIEKLVKRVWGSIQEIE